MGFLDHQRSRVDRRSVRIKLTEKGREVRDIVDALYHKHVRTVEQVGGINADELGVLNKTLHRLERFWTEEISTRPDGPRDLSERRYNEYPQALREADVLRARAEH